jgi:heptosyltransferase-1
MAETHQHIKRLPACSLQGLASEISTAIAVVGVDTGLAHLAAALRTPSLSLYGATESKLTGTMGERQIHLQADFECAPCLKRQCHYQGKSAVQPACYATIDVDRTWQALMQLIAAQDAVIV